MNRLHLLISGLIIYTNLSAQHWLWAKGEGGIGNDAANSITTDENGNAYITGNIAGEADFSGTVYHGNGIYDVFIAKYNPNGNLLWVKLAGGLGNDQGNCITYKNGFLYVGGSFEDTAYFESEIITSKGASDVFVAKYNSDGNLIWIKNAGGNAVDYVTALTIDNDENIYAAGYYQHAIDFDTVHLSSTNIYNECFLAKYNNNGQQQWATTTTGNNANLITGIAFDNHQSIYLTGYFGGSYQLAGKTVSSVSVSYDIFLAKVNTTNATCNWMVRAGSNYEDAANGVATDKNGMPVITGYFAGTATFGSNTITYIDYNDIFIARYDTLGNNLWVHAGKGHQLDEGFGIACDDDGNIFATGMFQNQVDFDGYVLSGYDRDIFLVSYNPNGNIRWIDKAGGVDTDCGLATTLTNSGAVCIAGYYLHTCFFGTTQIDYSQNNDLFVAEYSPPAVSTINETNTESNAKLFPNPANNYCMLYLNRAENIQVRITNQIGELIFETAATNELVLPATNLPAGIYFIQILSKNKMQTLKLLKQ